MRKFQKTYIEITNICNLSCEFCPKTTREKEYMGTQLFERILNQMKGRTKFLYFHVMGEPLMHPDLDMFFQMAYEYGFQVNITTNGKLINSVKEKLLAALSLRQLNISLHSFEANTPTNEIDEYLHSVLKFVDEALQKSKVLINLRLWNLSDKGLNIQNEIIINCLRKKFNVNEMVDKQVTLTKGIKLTNRVFLSQAEKFDWPSLEGKECGYKGFCYGLRDQIGFLVDGTVIPCCLDSEGNISLGNIGEKDIDDILSGQRAKDMYKGFSERVVVEELCRKCGYKTRFDKD